jgi:lipopolysaccharide/colanic/teichoic acid biosynthesis glycosyltransferase
MRRCVDVIGALTALIVTSPLMLIAAVGIRLTSPGPIFYRATRIARDRRSTSLRTTGGQPDRRRPEYCGREFTMYKFRTMHVNSDATSGAPITASADARIFPFGSWLRATKVDELPQFFNVLRGHMALVGPRPEAPEIVREYYTPLDRSTLQVPPGLTSPGALYYYTHGESQLQGDSVVQMYVDRLLPLKLAIDRVYISHASVRYDLRVLARTLRVIVLRVLGVKHYPEPPELAEVDLGQARRYPSGRTIAE